MPVSCERQHVDFLEDSSWHSHKFWIFSGIMPKDKQCQPLWSSVTLPVFQNWSFHQVHWSGKLCYNFLSPMTLPRRSIFLLGSHSVWLFWISFFLLMLVFVPQWLSLHSEILIMFLSQFPLTFHHIHNKIPHFIKLLMTILVLIGLVFMII